MPPKARVFLVASAEYLKDAAASLREAEHTVVSAWSVVDALRRLNRRTEEPDVTVIGDTFPLRATKEVSRDASIVFEQVVGKKFPDTTIVALRTGDWDEHGQRRNEFPENRFQTNSPQYTRDNLGNFVTRLPPQARR